MVLQDSRFKRSVLILGLLVKEDAEAELVELEMSSVFGGEAHAVST